MACIIPSFKHSCDFSLANTKYIVKESQSRFYLLSHDGCGAIALKDFAGWPDTHFCLPILARWFWLQHFEEPGEQISVRQSQRAVLCLWSTPALGPCLSGSQLSLLNLVELKILIKQDANHHDMMWYVWPDNDIEKISLSLESRESCSLNDLQHPHLGFA